ARSETPHSGCAAHGRACALRASKSPSRSACPLHGSPGAMARTASIRPRDRRFPTDTGGRARHTGAPLRGAAVARSTIASCCAGLAALALVVAGAPASAAAPPPCPGVRFLVDRTLVPGATLPFDVVTVDGAGDATIASGCPAAHARTSKRAGLD